MNLKVKKNINPNFNMSSMTDIIFLLIIFFMITSSFNNTNSINIKLPESNSTNVINKYLDIQITEKYDIYYNNNKYSLIDLKNILKKEYIKKKIVKTLIKSDKNVPIYLIIKVVDIIKAISPEATISIATKR